MQSFYLTPIAKRLYYLAKEIDKMTDYMTDYEMRTKLEKEETAVGKAKIIFLALDKVTVDTLVEYGIDIGRARTIIFQNFLPAEFIKRVSRGTYTIVNKGAKNFIRPPQKRGRPAKTVTIPSSLGLTDTTYSQLHTITHDAKIMMLRVCNLKPTGEREEIRYLAGKTLQNLVELENILG